ncbi:MAG: hypothetical protein ABJK28_15400 [Algibacter sp.]
MIAHAFGRQSKFEENKAIELAKLGYVGFTIDFMEREFEQSHQKRLNY